MMTRSLKICVVDDDQDLAESLADVLKMSGHGVHLAHSGEEAVEICSMRDFDMTFMDVKMPGMNGVESFLEIRKIKPNAQVIIMTGYSFEPLLNQARENGVAAILYKPVAMPQLAELLDRLTQSTTSAA